ncbi:MAG: hypothetical protein C5S49_04625 [Candidatus Methanogaster sp.]|nr:MAG: hypothetical protein C5S49_04625 [ANME-2 cluster archaeon]
MDRKEYLISKLREFALMASERIDITKMIFFSSMATGEAHKDNDIDLIIVSQSFRRVSFWKRAIALYDYWDPDYPVDFLCFTPEEFEKKTRGVKIVSEAVKKVLRLPEMDVFR